MKQTKSLAAVLLSTLLVTSLSIHAFASASSSQAHGTNVEVGFEAGTGIVPPVNPDEPDKPSGETGTNQAGPLSLDWVPTLSFGAFHAVSPMVKTYNTIIEKPYIQISDLRGSGSGWKVDASLSTFTSGGGNSLPGAYITLKNGRTNTATIAIPAPVPAAEVKLTSDNTLANVATALSQAGLGTWVIRWYPAEGANDDVQLTIPAAAASVGTHAATITWILYDAP